MYNIVGSHYKDIQCGRVVVYYIYIYIQYNIICIHIGAIQYIYEYNSLEYIYIPLYTRRWFTGIYFIDSFLRGLCKKKKYNNKKIFSQHTRTRLPRIRKKTYFFLRAFIQYIV